MELALDMDHKGKHPIRILNPPISPNQPSCTAVFLYADSLPKFNYFKALKLNDNNMMKPIIEDKLIPAKLITAENPSLRRFSTILTGNFVRYGKNFSEECIGWIEFIPHSADLVYIDQRRVKRRKVIIKIAKLYTPYESSFEFPRQCRYSYLIIKEIPQLQVSEYELEYNDILLHTIPKIETLIAICGKITVFKISLFLDKIRETFVIPAKMIIAVTDPMHLARNYYDIYSAELFTVDGNCIHSTIFITKD